MRDPHECPKCESTDTEAVHTDIQYDVIERVRVCNACPVEYVVAFGTPVLREVYDETGEVVL